MVYRPVTDQEWQYLLRRFRGLHGGRADERGRIVSRPIDEIRGLLNEGLPDSPVDTDERRRARAIVRERVRGHSIEAYADPYFELEWMRVVENNPTLGEWPQMTANRRLLWDAYYMRDTSEAVRKHAREQWRTVSSAAGRDDDHVWEDT
jgi:hypothetical protein